MNQVDILTDISRQIPPGDPVSGGLTSVEASDPKISEQEKLLVYLSGIKAKDEDALSDFYDDTLARVYGLAIRITGAEAEAEEVVSDVYWQVWQEVDHYNTKKASIMGWLLTICRSRAIDQLRKRKRNRTESTASDQGPEESTAEFENPEYLLANMQSKTCIKDALENLSTDQRQLVSLAFFRGMSYSEVAEYTGIPLGTVKSHIRRGLAYLKSELASHYGWVSDGEGQSEQA